MERVESPHPCDLQTADATHEFVPTTPGWPIGAFAIAPAPDPRSIPHQRRTNACGENAMRAQRRLLTWANWRTPVHEPAQTGHRATLQVDGWPLRLPKSSGYGGGAGEKLHRDFHRESRARVREPVSFVVRDSRLLLRMPGPHDRRKRINQQGMSQRGRWAQPFPRTGRVPARVRTQSNIAEESPTGYIAREIPPFLLH